MSPRPPLPARNAIYCPSTSISNPTGATALARSIQALTRATAKFIITVLWSAVVAAAPSASGASPATAGYVDSLRTSFASTCSSEGVAATCYPPAAVMFNHLYGYETDYADYLSHNGSVLNIVGLVDIFCGVFGDINAADPNYEFTLSVSGLVSQGTKVSTAELPGYTLYATAYTGGTATITCGIPRNAPLPGSMPQDPPNATVPSRFLDGDTWLGGDLYNLQSYFLTLPSLTGTCLIVVYVPDGGGDNITQVRFRPNWRDDGCRLTGAGDEYAVDCVWVGPLGGWEQGYTFRASGGRWTWSSWPSVNVASTPSCAVVGTPFQQLGSGFITDQSAELHFIQPDGTEYSAPYPTEALNYCGAFAHSYNSSTATQYGTYGYYAVGVPSGRRSPTTSFEIMPLGRPSSPTDLKVTNLGTGTSVRLDWTPSTSLETQGYHVYRWQTGMPATRITTTTVAFWEDNEGLARGQQYTYAVSAYDCAGEGQLSGAQTGTPDYYPVVLVHGLCGDGWDFSTMAEFLNARGVMKLVPFQYVHSGYTHLSDLSLSLRDAIRDATIQYGDPRVNVVAHSQGGLIARWLLQHDAESSSRVANLVMIGTPNHGSAMTALLAFRAIAILDPPLWYGISHTVLTCLTGNPVVPDLAPGSEFLNQLNYNSRQRDSSDPFNSCPALMPEITAAASQYWVIRGTGGWCGALGALIDGSVLICRPSDGVVSERQASLLVLDDGTHQKSDRDLPGGDEGRPTTHFGGSAGACNVEQLKATPVLAAVCNVLTGGTLTAPPESPTAVFARAADGAAASTSDSAVVLATFASELGPSGAHCDSVRIDDVRDLAVAVGAEAGGMVLTLRDPLGRQFSAADTTSGAVSYLADPAGTVVVMGLTSPVTGVWEVTCGAPGSEISQRYGVQVSGMAGAALRVGVPDGDLRGGAGIQAAIRKDGVNLGAGGSPWSVEMVATLVGPDSVSAPFVLFDDGAHGDDAANDGLFGATVPASVQQGTYGLSVSCSADSASVNRITRLAVGAFEAPALADLSIAPGDISVSRPLSGVDSFLVAATVHNGGTAEASQATVAFGEIGHPPFATSLTSIPPGDSAVLTCIWVPSRATTDTLVLVADVSGLVLQSRYDNDTARVQVEPSLVAVSPDAEPQLLELRQPFPNPSHRELLLDLVVPRPGHVTLRVYDIAGREIRTLISRSMSNGRHRVVWDGTDNGGGRVRPGVYFCDLHFEQSRLSRRIILLR